MSMITCCKDCEKRHTACWDYCEEYQKQKQAIEKKKAAERLAFELSDQRAEANRKARKGKRTTK